MADTEDNWNDVELHRDYLKADRNGWKLLYWKAQDKLDSWHLAAVFLIPLSLCGVWQIGSFLFKHIKLGWS